jgi:NitT/TauT family transport system permease protein
MATTASVRPAERIDGVVVPGAGARPGRRPGARAAVAVRTWAARLFRRGVVLAAFFGLWEVLPRTAVDPGYLPPFSEVARTVVDLFVGGEIYEHLTVSLQRSLSGFGLAVLVGIPLGLLMGGWRPVEEYLDPLVQTLRQTPVLALFPVFILCFGIGELSKVMMIFWGTVWPILLNTIGGTKSVDPVLVRSARSLGIRRFRLFRLVVVPATLPAILTGVRLGATFSVLMLVVAEYVGAKSGIGAFVINSQYAFQIPETYAAIVILAAIGLSVNALLVALERRATRWKGDRR